MEHSAVYEVEFLMGEKQMTINDLYNGIDYIMEFCITMFPATDEQMDLFTDYEALEEKKKREKAAFEKERRLQEAMLEIRRKYGKNAILKGTSLQEGATMRDRNQSIGGHKA